MSGESVVVTLRPCVYNMYRKSDFLCMLPGACIEIMLFSMQVGLDVYRLGISGGFQHGLYLWQAELAGDEAREQGVAQPGQRGCLQSADDEAVQYGV